MSGTEPSSNPDDLLGRASRLLTEANRAVARAHATGHWSADWTGVVDQLRRAAVALTALNEAGPVTAEPVRTTPHPLEGLPCTWCGRATITRIYGHPGHQHCWQHAGSPELPRPAAPAAEAVPARRRLTGTTAEDRFTLDAGQELRDFSRALRQIEAHRDATDEECAAALAAWHAALTVKGDALRYVSSRGMTGTAALRWLCARYPVMVPPRRLDDERVWEISRSRTTLDVLSFVDQDVDLAAAGEAGWCVTELDVNAQYLGAMRSVLLGDGEPDEVEHVAPDELRSVLACPGYVRLGTRPELPAAPTARLAFARVGDDWWLPTPSATYLHRDHGSALDVTGAVYWPRGRGRGETARHGKRLERWAQLFAEGRETLDRAAAESPAAAGAGAVLKAVYATFSGGWLRSRTLNNTETLRPDWGDQIVAQGGVNALRAVDKALAAPANAEIRLLGAMKDSFWFVGPGPGPVLPDALTITPRGGQPGKFHVNRYGPITDEIVTAHRRGRIGTLRRAITATDTARRERAPQ
ncbi:hypothetical protein [Umezawaea beigongshangensis]|uniref:hypothetical protein n=1 Tax=Umezawaea beigongshangensis TaxID=2780383 RepID=UPI0018F24396|nr:hypothetical protein [Umezawaea beigongshangensis]